MSLSQNPTSRNRTPSRSPAPLNTALPQMPDDDPTTANTTTTPETPQRRPSFGFLRRGKSVERLNSKRSTSGSKKLTKRQLKEQDNQLPQPPAVPMQPPKIPDLASPPSLQTFGGENVRPDSFAIVANHAHGSPAPQPRKSSTAERSVGAHGVPIPPMPGQSGYVDPYARTESITNRGRYSYASSAVSSVNNPRRVRRRKDPTPFNVLVVGARNSGKSSFVEFMRTSLTLPFRKQRPARDDFAPESGPSKFSPSFIAHYLESELDDGERIGVTLWDSEGLDQNVMDLQLRQIASFIESKFDETFTEETKIVRSPGARDTHIHCVFLILDPLQLEKSYGPSDSGGSATNGNAYGRSFIEPPSPRASPHGHKSDEMLVQVMRALQGKTTVIPVVSKADTITIDHMELLKRSVWTSMKQSGLDHLEALGLDDSVEDEDSFSEGSSDDSSDVGVSRGGRGRHNSKKFDERDEDYLHPHAARDMEDRSIHSRLDLTSSSEASSAIIPAPKGRKTPTNATPHVPLSILSPSPIIPHEPGVGRVGRRFPWGFADPYDSTHCDFVRLKELVFVEWRSELREASRDIWYEQWRTTRLNVVSPKASTRAKTITPERRQENISPVPNRGRLPASEPRRMQSATPSSSQGAQGASWPLPR